MQIEELLKPRYKVLGPYPNSPYKVGDLVERNPQGSTYLITKTGQSENYAFESELEKCPNLFKPMHWSEDRAISMLPNHVKHLRNPTAVFKVKNWAGTTSHENFPLLFLDGVDNILSAKEYEPATEQEFLEAQKRKNEKK